MEDEFYLKRLDSGLFTLQLIDYIMLEVCASGASSVSTKQNFWYMIFFRNLQGCCKIVNNFSIEQL